MSQIRHWPQVRLKLFLASALELGLARAADIPQPNTCVNVLHWEVSSGTFAEVVLGMADHWHGPQAASGVAD